MSKQKKSNIVLLCAAIVLAIAIFICWASTKPLALESAKSLTVNVIHSDGVIVSYPVNTTGRYLTDALRSCDFAVIEDTDYGPWIAELDGETADWTEGRFWAFTVNGEKPEELAGEFAIQNEDVIDLYLFTY